jgi:putative ABC transport system substrate-binding protein
MSDKLFSLTLSALLLAVCFSAEAQQSGKVFRIGILSGSSSSSPSLGMRTVQRELRALGYVEGKNVFFEYRYAEDKPERFNNDR